MDNLNAIKPLDFNLLRVPSEFLIDQCRFLPFLSLTVSQIKKKMFIIAVRQEATFFAYTNFSHFLNPHNSN